MKEIVDPERLEEFISEHETELTYEKYPSETKFERAKRHIAQGGGGRHTGPNK